MELAGKKVCIVVENLPVPFDRRVWQESLALKEAGAEVTVICPKTKAYPQEYEELDGIKIYRHPLPEANRSIEYIKEYLGALPWRGMQKHVVDKVLSSSSNDSTWEGGF